MGLSDKHVSWPLPSFFFNPFKSTTLVAPSRPEQTAARGPWGLNRGQPFVSPFNVDTCTE